MLRIAGVLGLILSLVGVAIWQGWVLNNQSSSTTDFFDTETLLGLEAFGDFDLDRHFNKDLSIVFYFSELSCKTCTTKELQNVADWHLRFGDVVDFYLVVHGQDQVYLNNLKRMGKVKYPILIEEYMGQMGMNKTTIALFRKQNQKVLASYFPTPDQVHLGALRKFEKRLLKELSGLANTAKSGKTT